MIGRVLALWLRYKAKLIAWHFRRSIKMDGAPKPRPPKLRAYNTQTKAWEEFDV